MKKLALPIINKNLCTLCGACVIGCPEEALIMEKQGPTFIQPEKCTYCVLCEEICPTDAIRAPFTISWSPGM
ncbi:MAG: 4Fe-4S binding protein [Anaerolineaceae bacterium]|nr:4Fe-4S binding protein [Anaerolineaceae bacterium]